MFRATFCPSLGA